MYRGLLVLLVPIMVTAKKSDLDSQLTEGQQAQNLLLSDVKHWETERATLEELLDGRDTLSSESLEKFQGQLDHAKKQEELAKAALQMQEIQLDQMKSQTSSKSAADLAQGAHLSASPLWTPGGEGQALPNLDWSAWTSAADAASKTPAAASPADAAWENPHKPEDLAAAQGKIPTAAGHDLHTGEDHHTTTGNCVVWLKNQKSGKHNRGECIPGETFGCHGDDHMWVDAGCRGSFECNGDHEKCESWEYKWEKCRCKKLAKSKFAELMQKNVTETAIDSKVANLLKRSKELTKQEQVLDWTGVMPVSQMEEKSTLPIDLTVKPEVPPLAEEPADEAENLQEQPEAQENQEMVQCKVKCQRFAMKSMGPEFENLSTPQECVSKCGEVYGS